MICRPGICLVILSASGCALLAPEDNAPTIADLGTKPVELRDTPIESSNRHAMQAYRSYLQTGDESEARPEAMRRIADLSLEAGEEPQAPSAPADLLYPEQVRDAVHMYQDVLTQYPERQGNDRVRYQLARAYERSGQTEKALATLDSLIASHPDSDHLTEAEFRRGEMLFVMQDYRDAEQAYLSVTGAGPATPFYRQALYKLGWCYFKQGLFEEGLDAYITLLDDQLPGDDTDMDMLDRPRRELLADTLRVVSLSFSYQAGADTVAEYFSRRGGRHYEDIVYNSLGSLYLQKERYTDAAQTFNTFVEANPWHRESPAFQLRVIETYDRGGFPTRVLQGKKDFVERYHLQSEYWQHNDPQQSQAVLGYLRDTLTGLAQHYHAVAQREHKPADIDAAAHWYRTYIASFVDDESTPGMHFLLAELLFDARRFEEATVAYRQTAYDYPVHAQAADAGYAAVLAAGKVESQLQGDARQAWHRESIEHSLRFATTFPSHPQATAVLVRSGEQLLALGELQRASEVAQHAIDTDNASPDQQRVAWTVLAHARFDLQDYLQAEQAYQQILQFTTINQDDKIAFNEKLAASIYKQGEAAREAGDLPAAVDHFLRVRTTTPAADIVATAEYDAAAGLLQLQDYAGAVTVLERFRASYPDHPQQAEVTRRLATAHLAQAAPLQAAIEFERIGRTDGDNTLRREALWQAAELYARAGEPDRAVQTYRDYTEAFPQPLEAAVEARQRIAVHYRDAGNAAQHRQWLQSIIDADSQAGKARTERTRFLAAQASLSLAETAWERYSEVRLTLPLKQSLASKRQHMEEALAAYARAADYQIATVSTAATFRSAAIYHQLGETLLASERPANLEGEALMQYDILLEEQAYPFEEKAIELHETNAARMEDGIYDAWVAKSLAQLAVLLPARYGKQERGADYVATLH